MHDPIPSLKSRSPRPLATAALPFLDPRRARYHLALCHGDRCPRCGSRRTRPWGGFAGRRRFRCDGCGRTFSTFTGTPLHYLKHIDRWRAFTRCVDACVPVRTAAERLNVHPTTAFRWRHRMLYDWRLRDDTRLGGQVRLGRIWFARSEKGRNPVRRRSRRHGYRYYSHIPPELRVQVAVAWQRDDATLAEVAPPTGDSGRAPARLLFPRMADVEELFAWLLPLPGLEDIAAPSGVRVNREPWLEHGPPPLARMERGLRRWLRPFRGVATRYLPHYLQWFREDYGDAWRSGQRSGRSGRRGQGVGAPRGRWPVERVSRSESAETGVAPRPATIPANRMRGPPRRS